LLVELWRQGLIEVDFGASDERAHAVYKVSINGPEAFWVIFNIPSQLIEHGLYLGICERA
jgi:hypothetical protein